MQLVYSGIGLELLALAGIILHDLFQIPVIFGILLHIGAVYLFTRGIETWLHKIRLTREVCFLLCLLLSIYGMLGILFQIFVLKKTRILTYVLKDQQPQEPRFYLRANPYRAWSISILKRSVTIPSPVTAACWPVIISTAPGTNSLCRKPSRALRP
jgi:hypothetical protein